MWKRERKKNKQTGNRGVPVKRIHTYLVDFLMPLLMDWTCSSESFQLYTLSLIALRAQEVSTWTTWRALTSVATGDRSGCATFPRTGAIIPVPVFPDGFKLDLGTICTLEERLWTGFR